MKHLALILCIFPFFGHSQSIDVFVGGTSTEFSGGTYDLNTSGGNANITIHLVNNIDSILSWKIERVSPSTNHWAEAMVILESSHSPFEGGGTTGPFPTPNWIMNFPINVMGDTVAVLDLTWDAVSEGCDLYAYYVIENNIRVDSFSINICKTVNIDELTARNVSIYPNPSCSVLNVEFETSVPEKVSVLDLLGNEIVTLEAFISMEIPTANLSNGMYFLTWREDDGIIREKKFQVQHPN